MVLGQEKVAPDIRLLRLEKEDTFFSQPGQFIRLFFPGVLDPFLPRPFMIFEEKKEELQVLYRIRGKFTQLLEKIPSESLIEVHGPLGKPFSLPEIDPVLFVGGGTGAACFNRYLPSLKGRKAFFLLGAEGSSTFWFNSFFPQEISAYATEDGSSGFKGTVLDLLPLYLKEIYPALIIASGPKELIRGLSSALKEIDAQVFFFIEEFMACGAGLCLSCVQALKKGERKESVKLCSDGLVWPMEEIFFP